MSKRGRARQLPAAGLDVLPWQRDVWLTLIEHVLAGKPGPPDLSRLEAFSTPAATQYSVTTPELLRSFRKYNAGKPYHRQVRPFGFMLMFQQNDDASTMMRVIAPFNRDPAKAARKAFDRDTGAPVSPKKLKTYAEALRTYYNHPEAKFLNGEHGDHGPTQRRHVIAKSIVHIGKEANKVDIQSVAGIDPDAQAEFYVGSATANRMKAILAALKKFGPTQVAREAGLSRKHVSAVAHSTTPVSETTFSKIECAISALEVGEAARVEESGQALAYLRAECKRIGLRQMARRLGLDPGRLSRIIKGERRLPLTLIRAVQSKGI